MNPTVDVSDSKRALLDQKLCVDKLSCSVCKSKFRVTLRNRQASLFCARDNVHCPPIIRLL